MPPLVTAVIWFIQEALRMASGESELARIYYQARELFRMWFAGGIITAAQQAQLKTWADQHEEATLAGEKPPELVIDPDPARPS